MNTFESPRYGSAALSDVLPSVLSALGVMDEPNPLGLSEGQSTVVLLVDGLGWNLLQRHHNEAPFLCSLAGRQLTAGFPTTTATSLTSLGTGLPPGVHGVTGYSSRVPGIEEPVNWLRWQTTRSGRDLREQLVPEQVQSHPTALERADAAGVAVSVVSNHAFQTSGLTRAALRGGTFVPSYTAADVVSAVRSASRARRPNLVYCYDGDLDLIGHVRGIDSDAWRVQLTIIDRLAELIADSIPVGARLVVTADHGMVDVPEHAKIDYDATPALSEDVEMLAGEPRMRYVHVVPGALTNVRRRWQAELGAAMHVLTREDAVDAGWFGPAVTPENCERIGDLIAVATADAAVVRRNAESRMSALRGQHGALTDDELLVPLLQMER